MMFFILLTISMTLLAGTIYISQRIDVNILQVEDKIKYPTDRLGMIYFNPYDNLEMTTDEYDEYMAEIVKKIGSSDSIEVICASEDGEGWSEADEELKNIQRANAEQWENYSYYSNRFQSENLVFTNINAGALNLCHMKFQKGGIVSKEDMEEGCVYVYLGNDYKEIPIGTEYTFRTGELKSRAIVAGILEEGETWLSDRVFWNGMLEQTPVVSADCMVFVETPESDLANGMYYKMFFVISKGISMSDAISELQEICAEYNIPTKIQTWETVKKSQTIEYENINELLKKLLYIVILSVVVLQSCIGITDFMTRKREYGILYANGAGHRDILMISILQSSISFLMSSIIVYLFGLILIELDEFTYEFFIRHVYFQTLAWGVLIVSISLAVPLIYIMRQKPAQLMRG
jgi:predicted secreted protein